MKTSKAQAIYQRFKPQIDKNLMMVNRDVCAVACGVGAERISAVRRMLGIPDTARKMFVGPVRQFLQRHPDFQTADAASTEAIADFAARHPAYKNHFNGAAR